MRTSHHHGHITPLWKHHPITNALSSAEIWQLLKSEKTPCYFTPTQCTLLFLSLSFVLRVETHFERREKLEYALCTPNSRIFAAVGWRRRFWCAQLHSVPLRTKRSNIGQFVQLRGATIWRRFRVEVLRKALCALILLRFASRKLSVGRNGGGRIIMTLGKCQLLARWTLIWMGTTARRVLESSLDNSHMVSTDYVHVAWAKQHFL